MLVRNPGEQTKELCAHMWIYTDTHIYMHVCVKSYVCIRSISTCKYVSFHVLLDIKGIAR